MIFSKKDNDLWQPNRLPGSLKWIVLNLALMVLLLGGCDVLNRWQQKLLPNLPTSTPPETQPLPSPTLDITPTTQLIQIITLWLPPQFDPAAGTTDGALLSARIKQFEALNPGVAVIVRIKAEEGPAGGLEALATTLQAAPQNLPSVVLLSGQDLQRAYDRTLIHPIAGLSSSPAAGDWYDFASKIARLNAEGLGLPMAGDALGIVYRPAQVGAPPSGWDDLLARNDPFLFAGNQREALFVLHLYLSGGGSLTDENGSPSLDEQKLNDSLRILSNGVQLGVFPYGVTDLSTDAEVWQAYEEKRGSWAYTWISHYLRNMPADSSAALAPGMDDDDFALAEAWVLALSEPLPEKQAASIRLMEYLTDSQFLADWSVAAGVIPARPSALANWSNQSLRGFVSQVALAAQPLPSPTLMDIISLPLRDAALQVLKRLQDPSSAASEASGKVAP